MRTRQLIVVLALVLVVVGCVAFVVGRDDESPEARPAPKGPASSSTTQAPSTIATVPVTPELLTFCEAAGTYFSLSTSEAATLEELREVAGGLAEAVAAMDAVAPDEVADELALFTAYAEQYRRTADEAPDMETALDELEVAFTSEVEEAATTALDWAATQCRPRDTSGG